MAYEKDLKIVYPNPAIIAHSNIVSSGSGKMTLRQLLATWVAHDLGHLRQMARVMAKNYAEEVGPWREYLPVVGE